MSGDKDTKMMLRVAGKHTIQYPKRERFNEDTQSIISEQRQIQKANQQKELLERNLGARTLSNGDSISRKTNLSKRSLSKSDLNKFFTEKKS
jgi:hypothetical protein